MIRVFGWAMEFEVAWCVRAFWVTVVLPILIASLPFSWLSSVHGLVLGFSKRGKIMQASSKKFSVPQKFFIHFYILAVVWTTFLLATIWFYAYKSVPMVSNPVNYSSIASELAGVSNFFTWLKTHSSRPEYRHSVWRSVFLLLLMEIQVLIRLYECVYIFNYSPSARMHILGYFTGLFYYAAAPLSLCCDFAPDVCRFVLITIAEFIVKGKTRMMTNLEIDWWEFAVPLVKLGWLQWVGAAIFCWGWVHQRRCHTILGSLRENREQSDEYVIPRGDWFEIVSSPHYLAEIVIYAGILVASGGTDFTVWLLFVFVVANLGIAAGETHRWYLRKFEDYPRNRLALIPFLL